MANQTNTLNDLSTLLKIPNKTLETLASKICLCIGSSIHDALQNNEQVIVLNIGIGTLSINLVDMQSKFIPSKELKSVIKRSVNERIDLLELELEKTLTDKLISICDEVI